MIRKFVVVMLHEMKVASESTVVSKKSVTGYLNIYTSLESHASFLHLYNFSLSSPLFSSYVLWTTEEVDPAKDLQDQLTIVCLKCNLIIDHMREVLFESITPPLLQRKTLFVFNNKSNNNKQQHQQHQHQHEAATATAQTRTNVSCSALIDHDFAYFLRETCSHLSLFSFCIVKWFSWWCVSLAEEKENTCKVSSISKSLFQYCMCHLLDVWGQVMRKE